MANKDDYLTEYRQFFENFAQTVNPNDQLPVKLASYKLVNVEVVGGIIDWTTQYLNQKKCPQQLVAALIKIIIDETRKLCKKQPVACGFNPTDNAYEPLKLMQTVISITYEVCLRYLDNSKLCSLPSPGPPYNPVSAYAIRNTRRRMEDRHVIIHDLSSLFVEQEATPSSYYAIFDGHAGHDAAAYSSAHLHQFLAESKDFIANPEQALREAFLKTDALFLDKCKVENLSSGTTAICALIHHKEKLLYIAWVGDSQAILVRQGHYIQFVQPHKPSREDEKKRVEENGGTVLFWDTWRVDGQLAVSRAIGDSEYKPYVTAVPDIIEVALNGTEDFLILACDGLWDIVSEGLAAKTVYNTIAENPDDIESISQRLVQLAKHQGSTDNITVIVVLLREPSRIAAEAAHWANCGNLIMDTLDNANANPFAINSNSDIILQKEGLLLDLAKQNGGTTTNGKRLADEEFDYDDDLGPETDVDAIDDVLMSPVNNHHFDNNKEEEKATFETEYFKNDPVKLPEREEASTPPADLVHDASGLIDNVAESCEDSDDEWNYIKGDLADKENVPPSDTDKEVCDITNSEEMSHLNPNAAEFVPLSPKKRTESPALQALMDEPLIARSPKRGPNNMDIKVPDPQEFECEIKSRPSEVNSNEEGDNKLSSEEIMVNLLNGKNVDEIEFHPVSTPIKTFKADEFHFGPNATPFSTPAKFDTSEALSTKAVFGDESTASYLDKVIDGSFACSEFSESQVVSKEQDPMSASFYHDTDNVDDSNPFDLNKVHTLPDNIEEFLEKPSEDSLLNDTISDLPEHDPISADIHTDLLGADANEVHEMKIETQHENELLISCETQKVVKSSFGEIDQCIELDRDSEAICSKIPLQTPNDIDLPSVLDSESPIPQLSPIVQPETSLVEGLVPSQSPDIPHSPALSPIPVDLAHSEPFVIPAQSLTLAQPPIHEQDFFLGKHQTEELVDAQSPIQEDVAIHEQLHQEHVSVVTQSATHEHAPLLHSPTIPDSTASIYSPTFGHSPIFARSPIPTHSPVCEQESLIPKQSLFGESHIPDTTEDNEPSDCPGSEPLICRMESPKEDIPASLDVDVGEVHTPHASSDLLTDVPDIIPTTYSPVPSHETETSVEDVTSSVKDSPLLSTSPINNRIEDVVQQAATLVLETSAIETSLLNNDVLISPESIIETESVATTDVNSFLERSLLPDVASPLSPNDVEDTILSASLMKESEPVHDLIVKSETIAPEFPVQQQIISPAEAVTKSVTDKKPLVTKSKVGVTSTAPPAKKPAPKTTTASTKPATKPLSKVAPATAKPASTLTKTTQAKTTPVSSPKPISKPLAKPPLTNGVAKAPAAKTTGLTSTTAKTVPSKTKPATARPATARPATAPLATKPPVKQITASATSRPTTLVSKSSTTTTTTTTGIKKTTMSTVTTAKSTAKPTTVSSPKEPSKPRPATAPATAPTTARPRSLTSKPLAKTPDTEKSIKEAVNKQTASRTVTAATAKTTGKVAPKVPATRTSLSKTTSATSKGSGDSKKPQELVRHPISKTKVTKITSKETKVHENGVENEIITVTSTTTIEEPELIIKDVSPIVDNSQLLD